MNVNTMRSFAFGLLLASGICGAVYYMGSDSNEVNSAKMQEISTEEEMKNELNSKGYHILTEDELQEQIAKAKAGAEDKVTTEAPEKIVYRTMITITSGMTSIDVGKALESAKIIKSSKEFSNLVERRGLSQDLRPGTFEVQSDMTIEQIISTVFKK